MDSEKVVRAALYPKILDGSVFSREAVVNDLSPKEFPDGSKGHVLSVGRLDMLPTDENVLNFGCHVAAISNEIRKSRFEASGKEFRRGRDSVHCRGAYDAVSSEIRDIENSVYQLNIQHCPENELEAHCDIEIKQIADEFTKAERRNARTEVIADIAALLHKPREFICDCDEDLREILESISLV